MGNRGRAIASGRRRAAPRPVSGGRSLRGAAALALVAGGMAFGSGVAPSEQMIWGWDTPSDVDWSLGSGLVDPSAAHPVGPANPSGLVLPVPGLGWYEDFAVTLPEGAGDWPAGEFIALDYRQGLDRFASGWLDLALVFSSPRNWWYVVGPVDSVLDGEWHTALWRYAPDQVGGGALTLRLATSTGDAGTLLIDRLRRVNPLFQFDFEDHSLAGWSLAEGCGLETRPERVHQGEASCRLFLPASTWHRAAWRTFSPEGDAQLLAQCNRLALLVYRLTDPSLERVFRLKLRLAWLSEPDRWGESAPVEVRGSGVWQSVLLPLDLSGVDPARPLRLHLVTESFAEEEVYVDSLRLLRVE